MRVVIVELSSSIVAQGQAFDGVDLLEPIPANRERLCGDRGTAHRINFQFWNRWRNSLSASSANWFRGVSSRCIASLAA